VRQYLTYSPTHISWVSASNKSVTLTHTHTHLQSKQCSWCLPQLVVPLGRDVFRRYRYKTIHDSSLLHIAKHCASKHAARRYEPNVPNESKTLADLSHLKSSFFKLFSWSSPGGNLMRPFIERKRLSRPVSWCIPGRV
jgi:hypothetical protein